MIRREMIKKIAIASVLPVIMYCVAAWMRVSGIKIGYVIFTEIVIGGVAFILLRAMKILPRG